MRFTVKVSLLIALLSPPLLVPRLGAADTTGPAPDDLPPVYVEIIDNVIRRPHDGWTAQTMENDRYATMEMAVEEAFRETKLPRDLKVVRFNARIPKEVPHLQIIVTQWQLDELAAMTGDFYCRLSARIFLPEGEKIDFGSVRGEASVWSAVVRSGGPDFQDYKLAADDALDQLKRRIIERLAPDRRGQP